MILDFNHEDCATAPPVCAATERNRPAYVILHHDWSPDVQDSGPFFLSQPSLAGWLRAGYHEVP